MINRNVSGQVAVQPTWAGHGFRYPDPYALPLRLIDGMPAQDYIDQLQGRILDAQDARVADTRVIIAGQNVVAGEYNFFDKPLHDQSQKSLDNTITIADKTEEYTDMIESGKMEGGATLIVESLQCSVFIPHRDFGAFTANTGLPSTGAPSGTDTNSATNNLLALNYSSWLTFSEPSKGTYADGQLWDFPSDRVLTGAFGGSTPEGFIQIGAGVSRPLRYIRVLQSLHHFDVKLEFFRTITFPLNVIIEVALCGVKLVG